ncbi:MAG: alpha/beta hydrolase [Candidatus Sericytochromatia bacterium]|nr:MAG: alpha/beta hydrolase [Candidatus Sericytochromatia bacterium]
MKLFYRKIGEGTPIIILHGLFGSGDNWLTFSKKLSSSYTIYLPDLRNHGNSPHDYVHDYPSMVNDLFEFVEENKILNPILIGHSMGGKVAMRYSINNPELVKKLIVVDIAPRVYKLRTKHILDALISIDLSKIKSRLEAEKILEEKIKSRDIRLFILKNLVRKEDMTFSWRLNLEVLRDNLEIIGGNFSDKERFEKETLFFKGEKSNYIQEDDYKLIYKIFPNSKIITVPNAGHWVQNNNLEFLYEKTKEFLGNE